MLALLPIDHRVALLALAALLLAAAVPLAYAWARLLPEEPPPFPIEAGSFPTIDHEPPQETPLKRKRDLIISVSLLICLTVAYLIRFPGFPNVVLLRWLNTFAPTEYWTIFAARIFVVASAIAASVYAVLRPGPLRIPFATAAALILVLWFLAPLLRVALLSAS